LSPLFRAPTRKACGGAFGLIVSSIVEVIFAALIAPIMMVIQTGSVLQIVFGLMLAWLPVGGWNDGATRNTIMPILTLALPQIAVVARMTRAAMIEVLRSNHIRTLRANGLPLSVIVRHALRGAALPVVSYLGPAAAALLTGSVVVETIFGIPGVGRYFVEGALNRDYTLVMGVVLFYASFLILFNLIVDVAYGLLDPRVRLT